MKKFKTAVSLIVIIAIFIIAIRDYYNFIKVPLQEQNKVIDDFKKDNDKFKDIYNYFSKFDSGVICCKSNNKIIVKQLNYSKNGSAYYAQIEVEDKNIEKKIKYVLEKLNFQYIECGEEYAVFWFKDQYDKACYIKYDNSITDDPGFEHIGWKVIKLEDNWYSVHILPWMVKNDKENSIVYIIVIVYHFIRGY